MTEHIHIPADDSPREMTDEPADVHFARIFSTDYGAKVAIELPAPWEDDGEAKDTLKELDWDRTHRTWDEEEEVWTVDFDALEETVEHMAEAGYEVTVAADVAQKLGGADNTADVEELVGEPATQEEIESWDPTNGHESAVLIGRDTTLVCPNCNHHRGLVAVCGLKDGEAETYRLHCAECGRKNVGRKTLGFGDGWSVEGVDEVNMMDDDWAHLQGTFPNKEWSDDKRAAAR